MQLSEHEKVLLGAWSNGQCGVPARVARRAWLILQESARVNPVALGQAYGGASRASQWLARFRGMGVLGLLDKPRAGRPATLVQQAAPQAGTESQWSDETITTEAFLKLDRRSKEVIWRMNRLSGQSMIRRRRTIDLVLAPPADLRDLAGVLLLPGLIALAVIERSDQVLDSELGLWMSVTPAVLMRVITEPSPPVNLAHDLLSVLKTGVGPASDKSKDKRCLKAKPSRKLSAEKELLLQRWVRAINKLVLAIPAGRMSIHVHGDTKEGHVFMRLLTLFAEYQLWANMDPAYPSKVNCMTLTCSEKERVSQSIEAWPLAADGNTAWMSLLRRCASYGHESFCWVKTP